MGAKWKQDEMLEMFDLAERGYTNKEVADVLNIKYKSKRTPRSVFKQKEVADDFEGYLDTLKRTDYKANGDRLIKTISSAVIAGYIRPWS